MAGKEEKILPVQTKNYKNILHEAAYPGHQSRMMLGFDPMPKHGYVMNMQASVLTSLD